MQSIGTEWNTPQTKMIYCTQVTNTVEFYYIVIRDVQSASEPLKCGNFAALILCIRNENRYNSKCQHIFRSIYHQNNASSHTHPRFFWKPYLKKGTPLFRWYEREQYNSHINFSLQKKMKCILISNTPNNQMFALKQSLLTMQLVEIQATLTCPSVM